MKKLKFFSAAAAFLALAACSQNGPSGDNVRLATTTSVRDSGLLDALIPAYRAGSKYKIQDIAVGSGQAMQMARNGEADLLLVHSPADEKQFVEDGFGLAPTAFMHNDFVIVGPAEDPAGVKKTKKAHEAFAAIASKCGLFVSRSDRSGTHTKERMLWGAADAKPVAHCYVETGQGMAATLSVASEKKAYTLADRATYLSMKKNISLEILLEGDQTLVNVYSLILVNPARFGTVNADGARDFFNYVLSAPAKKIVDEFGVEKFGRPLFVYDYKI
ncbi:MAG: ABC transporter substrate-binding protein [Elusimicrobiales bacterium]